MTDDRYANMTPGMLLREMNAWQNIVDAPKGPSSGAREEAKRQKFLAEAWYHRRTQDG
jgi:hypothetical protein